MNVPRPRGGQPGNQNARKHGFYSAVFTGQDKVNLNQAAEINGLDEEIALLRARLRSVVKNDPDNIRLISEAASTLARLMRTSHKLGFSRAENMEQARWNVIYTQLSRIGYSTQQIVDLYLGKFPYDRAENSVDPEMPANPDASK